MSERERERDTEGEAIGCLQTGDLGKGDIT